MSALNRRVLAVDRLVGDGLPYASPTARTGPRGQLNTAPQAVP